MLTRQRLLLGLMTSILGSAVYLVSPAWAQEQSPQAPAAQAETEQDQAETRADQAEQPKAEQQSEETPRAEQSQREQRQAERRQAEEKRKAEEKRQGERKADHEAGDAEPRQGEQARSGGQGRAWLGVMPQDPRAAQQFFREFGFPGAGRPEGDPQAGDQEQQRGVTVAQVYPQGPAARAGLRSGDVIIRLGDHELKELEDLYEAVNKLEPNQDVKIVVLRDGEERELNATLAARDDRFGGQAELRGFRGPMPLGPPPGFGGGGPALGGGANRMEELLNNVLQEVQQLRQEVRQLRGDQSGAAGQPGAADPSRPGAAADQPGAPATPPSPAEPPSPATPEGAAENP